MHMSKLSQSTSCAIKKHSGVNTCRVAETHAVYRNCIGVRLVSKVEVLGGQHRIELLGEEERERTTPIAVFDYGFLTKENEDTFPILIFRDSRHGQTGATCCGRKGPTAYSISLLVGSSKILVFADSFCKWIDFESTSGCSDSSRCGSGSGSTRDHLRVITWPTVVEKWLWERSETTMQDSQNFRWTTHKCACRRLQSITQLASLFCSASRVQNENWQRRKDEWTEEIRSKMEKANGAIWRESFVP